MGNRAYVAALVAFVGILLALRQTFFSGGNDDVAGGVPPPSPKVQGRNNTVLFVADSHEGVSNVHIATVFSLLQRHPEIEVHVASFPARKPGLDHAARHAGGKRQPTFWPLVGPSLVEAVSPNDSVGAGFLIHQPGVRGMDAVASIVPACIQPREPEVYLDLYKQVRKLIEEIDPAVIVHDLSTWPATDAIRESGRPHALIAANPLSDIMAGLQPRLQALWKYPAMASGFPFPVPWHRIPENIYMMVRLGWAVASPFNSRLEATRRFLREKKQEEGGDGPENPLDFFGNLQPGSAPLISQELEGACLPLEFRPGHAISVGPIVLSAAPIQEQDPELAGWLALRPTVFVNLGSAIRYSETQARVMAESLAALLNARPGLQVLWKFRKRHVPGHEQEPLFDDAVFRDPLKTHLSSGRVRIATWLDANPVSILQSGHVVAAVHHGGANVYGEAIKAGVPQVVLPLWVDCYNYAVLADQIGVGVWASRGTAPDWTVGELSAGLLGVVDDETPDGAAHAMRAKAEALRDRANVREGRDHAADIVAQMAASGR